jgi:hypothetical protein
MGVVNQRVKGRTYKYDLSGGIQKEDIMNVTLKQSDVDLGVKIKDSDVMVPVDVQNDYQKFVPAHAGQAIPNAQTGDHTAWIDTTGYRDISFLIMSDSGTGTYTGHVLWSNDGVTIHGITLNALPTLAQKERELTIGTRGKYVKLRLANNDTVPHTFSSWATLKV